MLGATFKLIPGLRCYDRKEVVPSVGDFVGLESIYRKLPNGEIAKITESDVMISGDEGSNPEINFDLGRGETSAGYAIFQCG